MVKRHTARESSRLIPEAPAGSARDLLTRSVADVIIRDSLERALAGGKKLRVKLGTDPTAPDLHLGHAVVLWKLREFQALGHTIVLIIGDATGQIGDPSGKSKVRPPLSPQELKRNAQTYLHQVGKILDLTQHVEARANSEWFARMSFSDLVGLMTQFTVARLAERDDFRARLRAQKDLYLHELFYPVLQAYDSVAVAADVEIGGTDQLFNMLAGRDLQRKLGKPEQDVVTVPLLVGTDGTEKMSKSLGNHIGIAEAPEAMFGKLMTIPDGVIPHYARLAARWDGAAVTALERRLAGGENPRDVKAEVAEAVVALYHGKAAAARARREFQRVFQKKQSPREIPEVAVRLGKWNPVDLLLALKHAPSKSAARRLITQGGVRLGGKTVQSWQDPVVVADGTVVQVGKRNVVRIAQTKSAKRRT